LPVILLSRIGGESEWLEVIEMGAFDLLVPPYDESYVLSLIEHAAASRLARQWHPLPVTPVAVA
jgi:DNA-binding NtrC family response regulator